MKIIFKFLFIFTLSILNLYPSFGQSQDHYVTLDGRQFKDGFGNDFYPKCMNFYISIVFPDDTHTAPEDLYVATYNSYGVNEYFDCSGTDECDTKLNIDFQRIHEMGFNAVHVVGLAPYTVDDGLRIETHSHHIFPSTDIFHYITNPNSDLYVQKLFELIDDVCIKAADNGLKLIIDCQQNDMFHSIGNFYLVNTPVIFYNEINNDMFVKTRLIG